MKRFRKSKTLVWMILGTIFISFVLMTTYASRSAGFIVNGLSWVDRVLATPFIWMRNTKDSLSNLLQTHEENAILKKQLQPAVNLEAENTSLKTENAELRNLLDMQKRYQGRLMLSADIINRDPLSWGDELIINKGKSNQVTKSFLAVSEKGLVGTVEKVEKDASWVRLLTSKKDVNPVAVKIQIAKGEVFGILSGYDQKNQAFIIDQLNTSDEIDKNAPVLTSGLGTYLVANIPVGTVLSVGDDSQNLTRQVLVKPKADFSKLSAVTLVGNN